MFGKLNSPARDRQFVLTDNKTASVDCVRIKKAFKGNIIQFWASLFTRQKMSIFGLSFVCFTGFHNLGIRWA